MSNIRDIDFATYLNTENKTDAQLNISLTNLRVFEKVKGKNFQLSLIFGGDKRETEILLCSQARSLYSVSYILFNQ